MIAYRSGGNVWGNLHALGVGRGREELKERERGEGKERRGREES